MERQRLVDVRTNNGIFTWNNHRGGKKHVSSYLGHFLVSQSILNKDIFLETFIMPCLGLDANLVGD